MAGTQTEINEYGPEVSPTEAREFSRRLEYLMEYATAIVFAGSLPPNLDEGFLVGFVQRSQERSLYTVVDSTPAVLRAALKAGPSLVSPNQHEAESRSEEHTSELQSRQYLVCRLLLEKKKQ